MAERGNIGSEWEDVYKRNLVYSYLYSCYCEGKRKIIEYLKALKK